MVKVITYGTYDVLHYGHIRLLERAKALGDYLIVGVTSDDFDRTRGKINVQQTLEERIEAVKSTGIADKVIIETYEGQKINDIKTYGVDIFTVGSDWVGKFDYLNEFCRVVYLPRTDGISSSEIRHENLMIKLGMIGYSSFLIKFYKEAHFVNTVEIIALYSDNLSNLSSLKDNLDIFSTGYDDFLHQVEAVYVHSHPQEHYEQVRTALLAGKHVLCESPIAYSYSQCAELFMIAKEVNCVLIEAIRTAYMTAYKRLLLLLKGGIIGKVVSIDATCTSLRTYNNFCEQSKKWGALEAWGPTALLPVFQILGTGYNSIDFFSIGLDDTPDIDGFTKVNFNYENATATIKVATTAKSESELIISGTRGYIFIPAPWWKTDYFEVRYEDAVENRRYFYQVDGEGIRYELVDFANAIKNKKAGFYIEKDITIAIANVMEKFKEKYARN